MVVRLNPNPRKSRSKMRLFLRTSDVPDTEPDIVEDIDSKETRQWRHRQWKSPRRVWVQWSPSREQNGVALVDGEVRSDTVASAMWRATRFWATLLYKIFNREWILEFKREESAAYTELIDHFRVTKQKFWSCEHDKYDKWNGLDFAKQWRWGLRQRIALMSDKWHNCDLETLVEETDIFDKGILSTKIKRKRLWFWRMSTWD